MSDEPRRAVWLTERHARALGAATVDAQTLIDARRALGEGWDAAPADAAEAVRVALTTPGEVYPDLVLGPLLASALTPEVLRALGCPRC